MTITEAFDNAPQNLTGEDLEEIQDVVRQIIDEPGENDLTLAALAFQAGRLYESQNDVITVDLDKDQASALLRLLLGSE